MDDYINIGSELKTTLGKDVCSERCLACWNILSLCMDQYRLTRCKLLVVEENICLWRGDTPNRYYLVSLLTKVYFSSPFMTEYNPPSQNILKTIIGIPVSLAKAIAD